MPSIRCVRETPTRDLQGPTDGLSLDLSQIHHGFCTAVQRSCRHDRLCKPRLQADGQILQQDLRTDRERAGVLDHVGELPHVSRPGVGQQGLGCRLGEAAHGLVVDAGLKPQEVLGKGQNLLRPFSERSHRDLKHIEAVEQVEPELTLADQFVQIAVSRADHPHVDRYRPGTAQWDHLALLQESQEASLQVGVEFSDFIQHKGAAVGRPDEADMGSLGSCIRPGLVPEHLALHRRTRRRGAINRDEGRVGPAAGEVDPAGSELLARTGLAAQEDGAVPPGDLEQSPVELAIVATRPAQAICLAHREDPSVC